MCACVSVCVCVCVCVRVCAHSVLRSKSLQVSVLQPSPVDFPEVVQLQALVFQDLHRALSIYYEG